MWKIFVERNGKLGFLTQISEILDHRDDLSKFHQNPCIYYWIPYSKILGIEKFRRFFFDEKFSHLEIFVFIENFCKSSVI